MKTWLTYFFGWGLFVLALIFVQWLGKFFIAFMQWSAPFACDAMDWLQARPAVFFFVLIALAATVSSIVKWFRAGQ